MRARVAGLSAHAQGKTNTAPARKAFLDRFERQVDPEGQLTPQERYKRAEQAKRAHMTALSMKAVAARRRRAEG
jgi:hypothetical protein